MKHGAKMRIQNSFCPSDHSCILLGYQLAWHLINKPEMLTRQKVRLLYQSNIRLACKRQDAKVIKMPQLAWQSLTASDCDDAGCKCCWLMLMLLSDAECW